MDTIRIPSDFRDFLRLLNENGVEYLLVGGYAVAHHGYVRATGDMDIWLARNPANAARVVAALHGFGFGEDSITAELFFADSPQHIFRIGHPPLRIELMTSISGVEFAECWSSRETTDLGGIAVSVIGLDKLIANKKASGRKKDLADVEELHR